MSFRSKNEFLEDTRRLKLWPRPAKTLMMREMAEESRHKKPHHPGF